MALYRDICEKISTGDQTKELYRFQGAKTASRMDSGGEYIYFSGSIDHHMYFTVKRLKQLLTRELQKENIAFNLKSIRDPETYGRIKKLVLYGDNLENLHSYRLTCSKDIGTLLRENFVYNTQKQSQKKNVERVDRRVYGGGYGVSEEWRELLTYLTYFVAEQKITRQDILGIIQQMKTFGGMNRKDSIDFLIRPKENYTYRVSPTLLSDFNKYNIIDALERILEKGLAMPDSSLSKNPDKTIKSIVENYESEREKTLVLLGKRKY